MPRGRHSGHVHDRPQPGGVALTYDRAELIRSVLEPSSRIAPGHQSVVVATRDGKVMTGVIRAETDQELVLADSEAKITRIPKAEITQRRSSDVSIMPARRRRPFPYKSSPIWWGFSSVSRVSRRRQAFLRGEVLRPSSVRKAARLEGTPAGLALRAASSRSRTVAPSGVLPTKILAA